MAITYDTTTGLRALLGGNLVSDIDTGFLSLAQDVAASLGHAMQEGVVDAGSFEVTQASGGASMVLDVASNVGTGAFVQNDSATGLPLIYLPPTGSKSTVTATTAHATLPRVDAVVVSTAGVVSIVAGTATSGATLDNARDGSHGGAVIPSNALQLADVLVPGADTTLSNNQIRDRRKWARGAYFSRDGTKAGDATTASSSMAATAALTQFRLETSGAPVEVAITGRASSQDTSDVRVAALVDGVSQGEIRIHGSAANEPDNFTLRLVLTALSAGSHTFEIGIASTGGAGVTLENSSNIFPRMVVREDARQSSVNNVTTSG